MCSIAGITNGGLEEVNKMLQSMVHRAPDDLGVYTDRSISLGMGRLSIIDLKSKNLCPYENNKIVLSFNGEVYNYKSLRSDLKKIGYNEFNFSIGESRKFHFEWSNTDNLILKLRKESKNNKLLWGDIYCK